MCILTDKDKIVSRCCSIIKKEVKKCDSTIYKLKGYEKYYKTEIVQRLKVSGYHVSEFIENDDIVVRKEFI